MNPTQSTLPPVTITQDSALEIEVCAQRARGLLYLLGIRAAACEADFDPDGPDPEEQKGILSLSMDVGNSLTRALLPITESETAESTANSPAQ